MVNIIVNFKSTKYLNFFHRIQEMLTNRQSDRQNIQASERRLAEERRKIESLAAQLTNERKNRKQLEEKAAR